jgi:nucleotide-binding universal stress UspA family protein
MSLLDGHLGIVVGVDDSSAAEAAVEWAARDAELRCTSLTLVHAISPNLTTWREEPLPPGLAQWQKEHGRRLLENAVRVAEKSCHHGGPTAINAKVLPSAAVSTMIELSNDAEMVVSGAYGSSNLSGRLLGSVSSGLLRHAHCPVAIIHPAQPRAPYREQAPILVGIDGSAAAESATAVAFDEAARRNVALIALHAWSDTDISQWPDLHWPTAQSMADKVLCEHLARWQEQYPGVNVRRIVARDQPAHTLLSYSAEAQLLVVGSRGRGGFSEMTVGSVSEAVALLAPIPVIVAR